MFVSIIILAAMAGLGAILYLHYVLTGGKRRHYADSPLQASEEPEEECCGMHITCERDSLSPVFSEEIVYFDDDELDYFSGREADSYNDDEIEQFRDVLLTLNPEEIAPWARSIQLRNIRMPETVRDELFMIVNEERAKVLKQSVEGNKARVFEEVS